jgi:hypothetical protein
LGDVRLGIPHFLNIFLVGGVGFILWQ